MTELSEDEIAKRFNDALRVLLTTPHQAHKDKPKSGLTLGERSQIAGRERAAARATGKMPAT